MTQPYSSELTARFGYDVDPGGEVEENSWIKQVLLRRTQRLTIEIKPVEMPQR